MVKDAAWLWRASAAVCGKGGIVLASRRMRFLLRALAHYSSVRPLLEAPPESPLGKLLRARPQAVGAAIWPYQCGGWSADTRLARIRDHYAVVEELGGVLDFPVDGGIVLADLGEIREGFHVVLDQPAWLLREGQLTINLFLGETRVYSLSFSLFHQEGAIAAFVGGIQGRDIEGALDLYRDLTKAAQGMRPRDLLVDIFRMFCAELGVGRILAVADAYRHQNDRRYFGPMPAETMRSNYDEIWTDRGGVCLDPMFFALAVDPPQRDLATEPAKKRGMYRRRYEMLRRIRGEMHERCSPLGQTAAKSVSH